MMNHLRSDRTGWRTVVNKTVMKSLVSALGMLLVTAYANQVAAQVRIPSDSALAVLDDSINTMMDRWQIPSVVYAVSSHGRIVHAQAYGLADVEL
jgi:hypothetical protein